MAEKQTKGESTPKKPETPTIQDEVFLHYQDAQAELNTRITFKERGFDTYDRIYRNYIDKAKWPFSARVPDGRGATLLKRKTDRLLANRLQGKMIPTKSGSDMGALVASELIMHQWGQVDMKTDESMLVRWRKADQSSRKYGAGFLFVPWRKTKTFDGPTVEHLENRNVLTQPGARSIDDSEWIQVRRYVTMSELKAVNDQAKAGPIYDKKVLDSLGEKDSKSSEYTSINKQVIGLSNAEKGSDRIELVTEYRRDRWVTFVPGQGGEKGSILRDIPNPYDHGEIPIIRLVYDLIDDDIYGVPELETVLPLIKANWALLSQYLDQAQTEMFAPLMVNPNQAQLDTLTFQSGARWLMNSPGKDVVKHESGSVSMNQFQGVYGLLSSLIMEGMGETGQDVSVLGAGLNDKTATEVQDMAMLRTSRDNANKVILSQAIAKMVYFWHRMNQQFISSEKLIRIVGKDAIKYLVEEGLHQWTMDDSGLTIVSTYAEENQLDFDTAYEELRMQGVLEPYAKPLHPTGKEGDQVPKLTLDKDGKTGFLSLSKEDLSGDYDYIVDIEAMGIPNDQSEVAARQLVSGLMLQTAPFMQQDGYRVKWKDFLTDLGEKAKLKNMDQYFETISQQGMQPGMPGEMGGMPGEMQDNSMMQGNGQPTGQPGAGQPGLEGAFAPQGAGAQGQGLPIQ